MFDWLLNSRIRARMVIAIMLPLLGLIGVSGVLIIDRQKTLFEMGRMQDITAVTPFIGALVHEIQKERGYSSGFISSKGGKFGNELKVQRQEVDKAVAALERNLTDFGSLVGSDAIIAKLKAFSDSRSKLTGVRDRIDGQGITPSEVVAYYTGTIASLIDIVGEMPRLTSDAGLDNAIASYIALLKVKEMAGQERALGAAGFAAGKFEQGIYYKFVSTISEQKAFIAFYDTFTNEAGREMFRQTLTGSDVEMVDQMQKVAIDSFQTGGAVAADANVWFSAMTAKINLLKKIEDAQADVIGTLAGRIHDNAVHGLVLSSSVCLITILLTIAFVMVVERGITVPLRSMTRTMGELADGNLSVEIRNRNLRNEIGDIANALEVFRDNMVRADRIAREQHREQEIKAEHQAKLESYIKEFEVTVMSVLEGLSSAELVMKRTAVAMDQGAAGTKTQSVAVASAAEESTANFQSVASATEELTASIREISEQVNNSSRIAQQAVQVADGATDKITQLEQTVAKIGAVADLISDIAAQTNLLALNATIEAARAGDAGKGFAVVANEVKNLATQTSKATEEIGHQIAQVQSSTGETVGAIHEVTGVIRTVNDVSASIAAAVEEQGAATQEIARNVEQASLGSAMVTESIHYVLESAESSARLAVEIGESSSSLSDQTATLRGNVEAFLGKVRKLSGEGMKKDILIEWVPALSVGNTQIDQEHKVLIAIVNDLYAAINAGSGQAAVGKAMTAMIDYTNTHFSHEEALMQQYRYVDFEKHRKQHEGFVSRLNSLKDAYESNSPEAGSQLLNLLGNWWTTHITVYDRKLADTLGRAI